MQRRQFLSLAAATLATPAILTSRAEADETIDWTMHKGTRINLFLSRHPWQEQIEPLIPEFEKLTGMKVRVNKLPEEQYLTKVVTDMSANSFKYDVFMTQYYEAPKFEQNGWTADIKPLMDDPKLTDRTAYDWQDFFPAARDIATIGGKYRDRVAITSEAQVLIYRKDILKQNGIEPPADFEALSAAAHKITKAGSPPYGITLRGGPSVWWPLYGIIRSYGGNYLSKDLKPLLSDPKTVAGLKEFADLASAAPPGITSYDWDEINTAMLSGQSAMFIDSSVIYSRLQDPSLSTVVGKIGVAPFPKGPGGRHASSHYWSISIANASKNKQAAWLFVQWATSKETQMKLAKKGILPPRASVANAPELDSVFGAEFKNAVAETLSSAVILPANLKFYELMDPLRAAVQEVILGNEDASKTLDGVDEQWKKILS